MLDQPIYGEGVVKKTLRIFVSSVLFGLFFCTVTFAQPLSPNDLIGTWFGEITNTNNPHRSLKIAKIDSGEGDEYSTSAEYGTLKTIERLTVRITSKGDVVTVKFVTGAKTMIELIFKSKDTLEGDFVPTTGSKKSLQLKRTTDEKIREVIAEINSPIKKPAEDVPEQCAFFVGSWELVQKGSPTGSKLFVSAVSKDCKITTQLINTPATTPPKGGYIQKELSDGVLSYPCPDDATCSIKRKGDVLEIWSSNRFGGTNLGYFKRITP